MLQHCTLSQLTLVYDIEKPSDCAAYGSVRSSFVFSHQWVNLGNGPFSFRCRNYFLWTFIYTAAATEFLFFCLQIKTVEMASPDLKTEKKDLDATDRLAQATWTGRQHLFRSLSIRIKSRMVMLSLFLSSNDHKFQFAIANLRLKASNQKPSTKHKPICAEKESKSRRWVHKVIVPSAFGSVFRWLLGRVGL